MPLAHCLALIFATMETVQTPVATFLAPNATIERIAEGLQFTEGPCELPDGRLIFSDIPANRMYQVASGKVEVFREPSQNANGHTLDPQGRLVSCEHGSRRVARQEKDGSTTVLAERFEGKRLNSPNDVVVRKDGAVFFTDPPYGIRPALAELGFNGVYAIVSGKLTLLDKSFDRPNGLVLSPDEQWLYVADTAKSHIRRFRLAPPPKLSREKGKGILEDPVFFPKGVDAGAIVSGGEVWAPVPHPDGIRVDSDGRIWATAGDGVHVISPEGKLLEVIKFPEQPANLCFSRNGKTLYVTARTGVYRVGVRVKGIAP